MSSYAAILALLDDLEAEERRRHERQVQQARLKLLLAKGFIFAQVGCSDQATKYQHHVEEILQRLQP